MTKHWNFILASRKAHECGQTGDGDGPPIETIRTGTLLRIAEALEQIRERLDPVWQEKRVEERKARLKAEEACKVRVRQFDLDLHGDRIPTWERVAGCPLPRHPISGVSVSEQVRKHCGVFRNWDVGGMGDAVTPPPLEPPRSLGSGKHYKRIWAEWLAKYDAGKLALEQEQPPRRGNRPTASDGNDEPHALGAGEGAEGLSREGGSV